MGKVATSRLSALMCSFFGAETSNYNNKNKYIFYDSIKPLILPTLTDSRPFPAQMMSGSGYDDDNDEEAAGLVASTIRCFRSIALVHWHGNTVCLSGNKIPSLDERKKSLKSTIKSPSVDEMCLELIRNRLPWQA